MSAMQAASLYIGLNIFILLALIALVIAYRLQHKVVIGDGGHPSLIRAIRAHGNATEVMPVVLIGLLGLASVGTSALIIHAIGIALTLGRALHAYGLSNDEGPSFGRMVGMLLSMGALLGTGILSLIAAF
jgi:uncharacterized protein